MYQINNFDSNSLKRIQIHFLNRTQPILLAHNNPKIKENYKKDYLIKDISLHKEFQYTFSPIRQICILAVIKNQHLSYQF